MRKIRTSFSMSAELARKLAQEAQELNISRSAYVSAILTMRAACLSAATQKQVRLGEAKTEREKKEEGRERPVGGERPGVT